MAAVMEATWPDAKKLEANRQHLLRELRQELQTYENRYELRSERLDAALEEGTIRETAEVVRWAIAYHTYQRLQDG